VIVNREDRLTMFARVMELSMMGLVTA